jgi:UDP-glucose 4-epimerase
MGRVIVTGGSGLLGSHIADVLIARVFRVTILDRQPSPYLQPDQEMVVGNILEADMVAEAISGCDIVFWAHPMAIIR